MGEEAPILDFKAPRPYAPWIKEEPEDFEDLKEEEITKISTETADKALISAVKTVAELGRAQDLQAYSRHPKIAPRFQSNYQTRITFGIHVGNAIEGSVGTEMKIDALYLSPDTQIALRIEELCEPYKSQILISEEFNSLLSDRGQLAVRKIDDIVMKETQG